ncbi:MAG TPA: protein-L-isoaspartate(D-aspartate) O-methyltransferase [Candidatus Thermoplasmatota archaeon]|nr:protein-L-isoaspartate(D-aspartate) O-methyltransferase [Candidatus Thermoplasmatota archaeon]
MDADDARRRMVDALAAQGVLHDARVRDALLDVPREAFTSDPWEDAPQPIGAGQTISAPHMVALMAEALELRPRQRVLEVGGGSGYHAAVLARLVEPGLVVAVEIVPELAQRARATLTRLGIRNVEVVEADGSGGYSARAPYDRISVAAGAPAIPRPLVAQLAPEGVMVIPVGPMDQQTLLRVDARGQSVPLMAVRFVPLLGAHGWQA